MSNEMTGPERMEAVLACAFRGIHHVRRINKESDKYWFVSVWGGISTFDFDQLTRLVIAAHHYCVRVEIGSSGPGMIKLHLSPRVRNGCMVTRHDTIRQAVDAIKFEGVEV